MRLRGLMAAMLLVTASPALAVDVDEFAEDELMDEFAFLEDAAVVESAARHKQECAEIAHSHRVAIGR